MNFDRFNDEPMIGDCNEEPDRRECKQCGTLFWVEVDGQEYCNDGCKAQFNSTEARKDRLRKCINCGATFLPSTKVQVFCDNDLCMEEFIDKL